MHASDPSAFDETDSDVWPQCIGVDGEALRKPLSGVGQYVFQLCRELAQVLPSSVALHAYARLPAERLALPSPRWVLRHERHAMWRRVPSFLWLRTRGAALCRDDGVELFWAGRTLHPNLPAPARTISTVHDLNHLIVPETMQPATLWSHRLWFERDLARADHVVANSLGTAERLHAMLGIRAHAVIKPGLDARFRPLTDEERARGREALAEHGIRPPYLLSVATLEPRKNVSAVLQAFLTLRARGELAGHQLVLAGAGGWRNRSIARALQRARSQDVLTPGYIPDDVLPALYALSEVLLLPSLYEGFGMPALEARACGTRVLVSDTPELREAAGPHGIVVQPTAEGIRHGILRALAAPRPSTECEALRAEYAWCVGASRLADLFVRA